jgi:hypothetical protein
VQPAILKVEVAGTSTRERSRAPSFVLEEKLLPRPDAKLKRSRRSNELPQWAAAVVKKATPKIAESLIEAAESLPRPTPTSPSKSASHGPAEEEDESLAALLLRLLRTPDTGENRGTEGPAAPAGASASENPSVG